MKLTVLWNETNAAGFAAVAPTASKDDVAASICGVNVDERAFTATDRYAVAEWEHSDEVAPQDTSRGITLPTVAAKWLIKQTPKALLGTRESREPHLVDMLELAIIWPEAEEDEPRPAARLEIRHKLDGNVYTSLAFTPTQGNFPSVHRLFPAPDFEGATFPTIALRPDFLKRMAEAALKLNEPFEAVRMTCMSTSNPNKPGPAVFTIRSVPQFRYLLQPNLLLN